ncbi:40S ribosomal protein S6 [Intoshia linei]|uniref:40S ribosomal protein S6 n=1 Tax=Intoshia linei TaxID=1819745 RepID=A0A177AX93_9BILA|nr:40S ribosomal protein S6 [Intoshia linei]
MLINVANPDTACQKKFNLESEVKLKNLYNKMIMSEVKGEELFDEWNGYILRITGGTDKQGFPMMKGVMTPDRVRLLLTSNHSCYNPRKKGERRRKSIRGCIIDTQIGTLNLIILKKGDGEIEGLTTTSIPRKYGPKRANKIRKLFNLSKTDDVTKYVIHRRLPAKTGFYIWFCIIIFCKDADGKVRKQLSKAPKIQRLITPVVLQRKRHRLSMKKKRAVRSKAIKDAYTKNFANYKKKLAADKLSERKRKASSRRKSASVSVAN